MLFYVTTKYLVLLQLLFLYTSVIYSPQIMESSVRIKTPQVTLLVAKTYKKELRTLESFLTSTEIS